VTKSNYKPGKTKKLDISIFYNKIDRYGLKHTNMILQYAWCIFHNSSATPTVWWPDQYVYKPGKTKKLDNFFFFFLATSYTDMLWNIEIWLCNMFDVYLIIQVQYQLYRDQTNMCLR
jgi:hypothetical protein